MICHRRHRNESVPDMCQEERNGRLRQYQLKPFNLRRTGEDERYLVPWRAVDLQG